MKSSILNIIDKYLQIFPEENKRQTKLIEFLNCQDDNSIIDWNNFAGHIVASGFIYAKDDNKFLVLYHKDLKMYLYPGGHINITDINPLYATKREIKEETGLDNLKQLNISEDELVPIDIDTHIIEYNERLNLQAHYHFDFRYLFTIDKIENINIDTEELGDYRWIDIKELSNDPNYGKTVTKIKKILQKFTK